MALNDYLGTLRRGWLVIALLVFLGLVAGALLWLAQPSRYQSTSSVYLSAANEVGASSLSNLSNYMESQMITYSVLAGKSVVLDPVAAQVGQGISPAEVAEMTSVNIPTESYIIEVTATHDDAELAATVSNAVSSRLVTAVSELAPQNQGVPAVALRPIQEATAATSPTQSSPSLFISAGALLGLVVGLGVALARESLRSSGGHVSGADPS